jgi:hypothetical protein
MTRRVLWVPGMMALAVVAGGCSDNSRTPQLARPIDDTRSHIKTAVQLTEEPRPDKSDPAAEEVVRAALNAHSGNRPERLQELKSVRFTREGRGHTGVTTPVSQRWEVSAVWPDRIRFELHLPGQQVGILCRDGNTAWAAGSDKPRLVMTDQQAEQFRIDASAEWLWMLFPLNDPGTVVAPAGDIEVNEKPATGIRVWAPGITDAILHFDKESKLLTRMTFAGWENGEKVTKEVRITSSKDYHGLTLPEAMSLNSNSRYLAEWKMTAIDFQAAIDPKVFENP